ncbi:hypothetical protein QDR00_04045 [Serratia ureilytica]|uniref:hypothetical protein n=1 Tax=Serratia ureilytica TaxID=300181 RepID=UPI00334DE2F5
MKYFSTGFFLNKNTEIKDIIRTCAIWVSGSPHSAFESFNLEEKIENDNEFEIESKNEMISFIKHDGINDIIATFRYSKLSPPQRWITDISISKSKDNSSVWVQVESEVETQNVTFKAPRPKKPLIVLQLIEAFPGGFDDEFAMSIHPIYLEKNTIESFSKAKKIINSEFGNRLPTVYISTNYNYKKHAYNVIPERLSRKLCGLAHVIVEPEERLFSHKLKHEVDFRNTYGGTIGIYWPNNQGISIHRKNYLSAKQIEDEIYQEILQATSTLSPLKKCGWNEVNNQKTRKNIELLKNKASGNTDADHDKKMLQLYEEDNQYLNIEIDALKQKIYNLESKISAMQTKAPRQGDITLLLDSEIEFFDGEAIEFLINHLERTTDNTIKDSRRHHIISSLISGNKTNKIIENKDAQLKQALTGYRKMDSKTKNELESIGFEIEESKHFKITYYGDSRYYYTLPKTGSDYRGAMNAYSDISNKIFY